jgi:hypothetical protein
MPIGLAAKTLNSEDVFFLDEEFGVVKAFRHDDKSGDTGADHIR